MREDTLDVYVDGKRVKELVDYVTVSDAARIPIRAIKADLAHRLAEEIVNKLFEFKKIRVGEKDGQVTYRAGIKIIVPENPE